MGNGERLENEVRTLSTEELATFREWFREFDSWDREIEADASSGKLHDLAERASKAHRAGETTSL